MASYGKYDLIQKPLFQNRQARPWLKDARSSFPFDQPDGRSYHYSVEQTPTHKKALETGLMMGLTCFCTDQDIAETATGIRKVFETYIR